MQEYNVSAEVADLITSVFLLGYVFGVSLIVRDSAVFS